MFDYHLSSLQQFETGLEASVDRNMQAMVQRPARSEIDNLDKRDQEPCHVLEQGLLKLRITSFQDPRNNEMTKLRCTIGVLNNTRGSVITLERSRGVTRGSVKREVESAKWGHVVSA